MAKGIWRTGASQMNDFYNTEICRNFFRELEIPYHNRIQNINIVFSANEGIRVTIEYIPELDK